MTDIHDFSNLISGGLASSKSIPAKIRQRVAPDILKSIQPQQIQEAEDDGWVVAAKFKRAVRMRKPKDEYLVFEDRVWATFAKLGFPQINDAHGTSILYGESKEESYPIQVLAADEEVVLVVICRTATTIQNARFKKDLENLSSCRAKIQLGLKRNFPGRKVKFILATKNYIIGDTTVELLSRADVTHMDEDAIEYYFTLAEHLGAAAKYQLLGSLFANTKIPNLDPEVVAIEARMGGHKYYSFSIEPSKLLKIAYILHRNKANSSSIPTYQRLIKKNRLKGVSQFVEKGGYFPNSLIINVAPGPKGLNFDPFPKHIGDTRAGILHLPQVYRAAYIIDGQHRLYGYAGSSRAETDLVPVVAFVNLELSDQVRLFMQINENQQAVPKALRNTLNSDLLYGSNDRREQARALKLHVAQQLGDNKSSPLYGRVLIGESSKTSLRCLTLDAISRGIDKGNYLGTFTKNDIKDLGTFYRGSNDASLGPMLEFLNLSLTHLRDGLQTQYKLGSADGGFVFINNGVEALIRIFGDLVGHVAHSNSYPPQTQSARKIYSDIAPYLDPIIVHLSGISTKAGLEYRKLYGSGASAKYWRRLQEAVREIHPDFDPAGLTDYLADEKKQFNDESREMVAEIENTLKSTIKKILENEHGANWQKNGIPKKIQLSAGKTAVERNAERELDEEISLWDCLYLVEYAEIITSSQKTWQELFEKLYTRPGEEKKSGGRAAKVAWIGKLNSIRNDVTHGRTISAEDHAFVQAIRGWLILGETQNSLQA